MDMSSSCEKLETIHLSPMGYLHVRPGIDQMSEASTITVVAALGCTTKYVFNQASRNMELISDKDKTISMLL